MRCVRSMFRQIAAGSGPAFEVLDACRGWLAERQDCTGKTGVIGFCMGGGFALMRAPRAEFAVALAPVLALARLQYDKGAAEDAWQRIFAFFGTHLKDAAS